MARIQAVAEQFRIAMQSSLEATQKELVRVAKTEHARIMTTAPLPASFTRRVDGALGAPEENVRFNGVIHYEYPRLDMVVHAAFLALIDKSPFLSGEYIRGHTLFIDGLAVLNGIPGESGTWFRRWRPGQELVIANFVPYARVIELNRHPRIPNWAVRVPGTDHVYQQAQQIVQRRYGNVARIRFTWRGIIPGANQGVIGGRAGNASAVRYPALVISER